MASPASRSSCPAKIADAGEYERKLDDAMQSDPATGFLHRRNFIEKLRVRLAEPAKGGVRCVVYAEPDKYEALHEELGVLMGEDFLSDFARCCASSSSPAISPGASATMASCCSSSAAIRRTSRPGPSTSCTRSRPRFSRPAPSRCPRPAPSGSGRCPRKCGTPDGPANDAFMAHRQGREMGGNRVQLLEHTGAMLRLQDQDRALGQADQGAR